MRRTPARCPRSSRDNRVVIRLALTLALALASPALAQGAPGREWLGVLNALVPREGFRLIENLAYGPHARQRLDVYLPVPARADAPLAVFGYGGGFREGARSEFLFVGQALAELGFVTVIPDYRLFPQVRGAALIEDLGRAVAWAQANARQYGADPSRTVLVGHSAGAYALAALAADPARLRAVGADPAGVRAAVLLSGAYVGLEALAPDLVEPLRAAPGGAILEPALLVDGDEPPFVVIHGARDGLVPVEGARRMVQRLRDAGGRALYYELPGADHNAPLTTLAQPLRAFGAAWDALRDGLVRLGLIPSGP